MKKLLITDDEDSFRLHLSHLFERKGYIVIEAKTGHQTIEIIHRERFDVALLDIVLPDMDGIDVLEQLKQIQSDIQVIMMTGNATIENAIASMKLGAYDYLIKPFDLEELTILVERASELSELKRESEIYKLERNRKEKFDEFVGKSTHFVQVLDMVDKVAPTDSTVLITGETGTGKELIAKAIHRKSLRAEKPFVVVNCGAIQDALLESEMFGHEKGAFTGAVKTKRGLIEVADSGTLFLDEIGDVSPGFQTKLLRFLESGDYRPVGSTQTFRSEARVIAATNRNLKQLLQNQLFREDLYYRLNVFNVHLLPLRERKDDISPIVQYSLKKICFRTGKCINKISEEALSLLQSYTWPGNVRELENVIERAVILCAANAIQPHDLPFDIQIRQESQSRGLDEKSLANTEKKHLMEVLIQTNGNKSQTARILGITKKTLYRKLRKYELIE